MRKRRQGIFIIGVLLFTVLVVMFLGAAITLSPAGLAQASQAATQDEAERAAQTGVDYILGRLKQNPSICYNEMGNYAITTVDTPEMFVREDHGNIVGLMWDREGKSVSQFRIRFNFQDGQGQSQTEKLSDSGMVFDLPFVSINNTPSASERDIPKVTGSSPNYSVAGNAPILGTVPGHSIYLVVEGRSGPALSVLNKTNPNGTPGFGRYSRKVVQTTYHVTNLGQPITDAVIMSAGELAITALQGNSVLLDSSSSAPARLRSLDDIKVKDDKNNSASTATAGPSVTGKIIAKNYQGGLGTGVTYQGLTTGDGFYKLGWNDIIKANGAHSLPGGTYTVDENGNLRYFNMTKKDYIKWMSNPTNAASAYASSGDPFTLPSGVSVVNQGSGKYEVVVSQDILVTPSQAKNIEDFALIPKRGASSGPSTSVAGTPPTGLPTNVHNFYGNGNFITGDNNNYQSSTNEYALAGLLFSAAGQPVPTGFSNPTINGSNVDWNVPGGGVIHVKYNEGNPSVKFDNFGTPGSSSWSNLETILTNNSGVFTQLTNILGGGGGEEAQTVAGSTSPFTTNDLTLKLAPPQGSTATLTVPGDVTIGAALDGKGGSITSEKSINLLGFGVDLQQQPNVTNSVSLYAKGDININTYYESQIGGTGQPGQVGYRDVSLTGVLYAWGDVNVRVGDKAQTSTWRDFNLTGTLVAYGGNPATSDPDPHKSKVNVMARQSRLKFDPAYVLNLMAQFPADAKFGRVSYQVR